MAKRLYRMLGLLGLLGGGWMGWEIGSFHARWLSVVLALLGAALGLYLGRRTWLRNF